MVLNEQLVQQLASELIKSGLVASQHDLNKVLADIKAQSASSRDWAGESKHRGTGIAQAIRGLAAMQGRVISTETVKADLEYVQRTLVTSATPGSYLTPTVQADAIIEILGKGGVVRAAGATIWPMTSIQKLNIPTETANPTVEYLTETTAQTPSDPNLGQLAMDLKEARALIALPNNLLRVSVPAVDGIVTRLLGNAFAKNEDLAVFQGIAGGPTSIGNQTNVTIIDQAGAALTYSDLLGMLSQAASLEAEGPFCWFMRPETFFSKILGLVDQNGRPIVTGYNSLAGGANDGGSAFVGQSAGAAGNVRYLLMGFPVYLSVRIPNHVGSGSATSFIVLTNPSYLHIGDAGSIEIAVSGERFFDSNQTAIRGVQRHDFQAQKGPILLDNVI